MNKQNHTHNRCSTRKLTQKMRSDHLWNLVENRQCQARARFECSIISIKTTYFEYFIWPTRYFNTSNVCLHIKISIPSRKSFGLKPEFDISIRKRQRYFSWIFHCFKQAEKTSSFNQSSSWTENMCLEFHCALKKYSKHRMVDGSYTRLFRSWDWHVKIKQRLRPIKVLA